MIPIGPIADTLGGPDETHIFVHDAATFPGFKALRKQRPESDTYDERALLFARAHDIVCVRDQVDEDYLEFLRDLGIGPASGHLIELAAPESLIRGKPMAELIRETPWCIDRICDLSRDSVRVAVNPYAATRSDFDLAADLKRLLDGTVVVQGGDPRAAGLANNKYHAYLMALESGIPAVKAQLVKTFRPSGRNTEDVVELRSAVSRFSRKTGKAVIRGLTGISGMCTLIADPASSTLDEDLRRLIDRETSGKFLVQDLEGIVTSPNVQCFIEPNQGGVACVSITDQYLDTQLVHHGNIYPSVAATIPCMLGSAAGLAKRLQEQGYAGLVGFDFVEHTDPETGCNVHFLAEINARVNAAAYPCFLMERIAQRQRRDNRPIPHGFFSTHLKTRAKSFKKFRKSYGARLFDSKTGCGMIPYHTSALAHGSCSVVIFGGSRDEVLGLHMEIDRMN